jgi:Fur family transcriptional regulator, ferric uptake regulator
MIRPVTVDVHGTVRTRLRAVGQRYTPQRQALVDVLSREGRPLAIGQVITSAAGLPQSSVYRNLAVLEQAGVVRRVITHDEFGRYELDEELTEHHHHLICSTCGRVQDVTVPAELEQRMGRTLDRLARRTGFASVSHRLDVIGTCRSCA